MREQLRNFILDPSMQNAFRYVRSTHELRIPFDRRFVAIMFEEYGNVPKSLPPYLSDEVILGDADDGDARRLLDFRHPAHSAQSLFLVDGWRGEVKVSVTRVTRRVPMGWRIDWYERFWSAMQSAAFPGRTRRTTAFRRWHRVNRFGWEQIGNQRLVHPRGGFRMRPRVRRHERPEHEIVRQERTNRHMSNYNRSLPVPYAQVDDDFFREWMVTPGASTFQPRQVPDQSFWVDRRAHAAETKQVALEVANQARIDAVMAGFYVEVPSAAQSPGPM